MFKDRGWKKALALMLVASIIAPSVLFMQPKETDAFLGCLLNSLLSKGVDKLKGLASSIATVPVYDRTNAGLNSDIKAEAKTQTTKECLLDFAVSVVANVLIKSITKSIVNWINGGFNGSPSFVTNVDGFLEDIGDQVIGESIGSLAGIGDILCSPFDLDLRFALNIHYSASSSDRIRCRLSDIQENIHNAFTSGNFGGQAGWNQWFAIHSSPQNNPYGSFLKMTSDIDARIAGRHDIGVKKLDWGGGFMSWETCPSDDLDGEDAYHERLAGDCTVNTPGSVIEGQLNATLPAELRKIEAADEINEIMNALVNQALVKVMSATGLGGSTKAPAGGGRSYFDKYSSGDPDKDFENAIKPATATLPKGISISCSAFHQNVYTVVNSEKTDYKHGGNALGTGVDFKKHVDVQIYNPLSETDENIPAFSNPEPAVKKIDDKTPRQFWTPEDLENVRLFCGANVLNEYNRRVAPEDSYDQNSLPTDSLENPSVSGNIALGKRAKQSSTYTGYGYSPSASLAVNGSKDGNNYYGLALTRIGGTQWWSVDLGTMEDSTSTDWEVDEINEIRVYGATSHEYGRFAMYSDFDLVITKNEISTPSTTFFEKNKGEIVHEQQNLRIDRQNGNNELIIPFDKPVSGGRYVYILKGNFSNDHLGISEVIINGKQTKISEKGRDPEEMKKLLPPTATISGPAGDLNLSAVPLTVKDLNKDVADVTLSATLLGVTDFNNRSTTEIKFDQLFDPSAESSVNIEMQSGNETLITKSDLSVFGLNSAQATHPTKFKLEEGVESTITYNIKPKIGATRGSYKLITRLKDSNGVIFATHELNFKVE